MGGCSEVSKVVKVFKVTNGPNSAEVFIGLIPLVERRPHLYESAR